MIPGPHLALRPGHGGLGKIRILIFVSRKPKRRHAGLCPGCLRLCGGQGGIKQARGLPPSALQKQSGPLSLPPYGGSLGPEGHRSDLVPSSAAPADATLPDLTPHTSSTRTRAHTHKGTFWWWWWFFCLFFFLCTLQQERARACRTDEGTNEHYKNITICKISFTLSAFTQRGGDPGCWAVGSVSVSQVYGIV